MISEYRFTKPRQAPYYKGMVEHKGQKKYKKISLRYLKNAGLYYLERFPASTGHFRKVMHRKIDRSFKDHPDQQREECEAWLEQVIENFQEYGYLDDQNFAKSTAHSLRHKGYSKIFSLQKMRFKGVPEELAKAQIAQVDAQLLENTPTSEHSNADYLTALKLCKKRRIGPFSTKTPEDHQKFKQKSLAALARAGYSYDVAQKALETAPEEALELIHNTY